MTNAKIYLNVPYAEKDQAKALGARWDAPNKKWYAPSGVDLAPFAKWQSEPDSPKPSLTTAKKPGSWKSPSSSLSSNNGAGGAFTYATIKDFVAYSGDEPPWE